jgi:hypothetical protein
MPTPITHAEARRIAAEWHGDPCLLPPEWRTPGINTLASTGAIPRSTALEVQRLRESTGAQDASTPGAFGAAAELQALLDYVRHFEPRGPVPGWHLLNTLSPPTGEP